jgi:hypothetical protein
VDPWDFRKDPYTKPIFQQQQNYRAFCESMYSIRIFLIAWNYWNKKWSFIFILEHFMYIGSPQSRNLDQNIATPAFCRI